MPQPGWLGLFFLLHSLNIIQAFPPQIRQRAQAGL